MVRTVAQIDVEMNSQTPAAAEEYGRAVGGQTRPVRRQKQVGGQFFTKSFADLPQIRRPDLLAHLHDEFCVEAEPATPGLMHGTQGRQIDAVLPFIVGGAAPVNPIVNLRCSPWIETAPPLTLHSIHDIAVPVHQHGG